MAGLVCVHVSDGRRRTGLGALRIAAAQVALDDLAARLVIIHGAEGAGDGAHLAPDAQPVMDFLDALIIGADGIYRARLLAPRFIALGAGVGDEACVLMEVKNPDTRFRWIELAFLLVRAGQFALLAAGTFPRIDNQ